MKYDAILMDADETLFDFLRAEQVSITHVIGELGIRDERAPSLFHQINRRCWDDLEKGIITKQQLKHRRFAELGAALGVEIDVEWIASEYEAILGEQSFLLDHALDTVRRIAEKRPIAIVTNGIARVQRRRMEHSEIRPFISALVISEEVGADKPDPKMVFYALRALGDIAPDRAVLIGDSLSSDMRAASRAGVDRCWYNPRGVAAPSDLVISYQIRDIREAVDIALQ